MNTFTTLYVVDSSTYTAKMSDFGVELIKGLDVEGSKFLSLDGWDTLLEEHHGQVESIYNAL